MHAKTIGLIAHTGKPGVAELIGAIAQEFDRFSISTLFEKETGYCVAGPCAGRHLLPVPLKVESGFVMLADDVDVAALTASAA